MTYSPNKSIRKAFAILEHLNETRGGLTASNVARRSNIPSATTHRLLKELTELGYVRWDSKKQTYGVGFRLTLFGNRRLIIERIARRARPTLRNLSQQSGLAAYLASLDGQQIIIEDRAVNEEQSRRYHSIGTHIDAHTHSLGKALLALLPHQTVLATYEAAKLNASTTNTIRTTAMLIKHLREVTAKGYAVDNEEFRAGNRSIATALVNPIGRALCAICLEGPKHKLNNDRLLGLAAMLTRAADTVMKDIKEPTVLHW